MGRANRPWYRTDRREWYMTINGVKTRLRVFDPDDEAGAVAAAADLAGGREAGRPEPGGETVAAAVGRFERDELPRRRPDTVASYTQRLSWVVRRFGRVRVADLDPRAVEAAAAGEAGWSAGTRRLTLTVCQVCVRWAGRDGFKLAKPHTPPRDERFVLTREEFEAIMGECRGDFAPLVQVMFLTGCRPGEARRLTCEQVNWQSGRAVLHEHKTAGKTGRPKSLYLSDAALGVLRGQRAKYGGGHLFRGVRGQPLSSAAVRWRWRRVRDLLGLRAQVIPYSLRHSFATHLLEGGASSRDVAELLGHTSTAMVEKTYGHFTSIDRLRGVAGRLDGAG